MSSEHEVFGGDKAHSTQPHTVEEEEDEDVFRYEDYSQRLNGSDNPDEDDDDDDDVFRYEDHTGLQDGKQDSDDDDEPFVYQPLDETGNILSNPTHTPQPNPSLPPTALDPLIEHEKMHAAVISGDLDLLKRLVGSAVANGQLAVFSLVNEPSPLGGLTLLHLAATRGHLNIVHWLVMECGAIIGSEDNEGETSLHKAALNGHLDVLRLLVSRASAEDVHAQDADGWTALHNACSKGYLDIVRFLCEQDIADEDTCQRPVDKKSKGGWTPLMNAASKGHLPVVNYLLSKQNADPLIRNKWGEAAYDIAASVFEIWICQVLAKAEMSIWRRRTTAIYNPLATHTTVPLLLHENQRLDTRIKSLALAGGRPKFSGSGLGKKGRTSPFELRMPTYDSEISGKKDIPAWRSDVELPVRNQPFALPIPREHSIQGGAERSHFWLSDWTLDLTAPRADATEGWQYATSFSEPDENWTANPPPALERLLNGTSLLSPAPATPYMTTWVRRRRWVRVMRRRLDIPALPFMESDGSLYSLTNEGGLIPHVDHNPDHQSPAADEQDGAELSSIPLPSPFLSQSRDYVSRAKYLSGGHLTLDENSHNISPAQVRRSIAKLERAVSELRIGVLNDVDGDRKTQAEVILKTYSRELERQRLHAGSTGITRDSTDDESTDDDSEVFHYPGASPSFQPHSPSIRAPSADYFNHHEGTLPTDLSPHLSQSAEFRVPTHDTPQKVVTPQWRAPEPHVLGGRWESDAVVTQCNECRRRFTFILRKHHCRKCGLIFCDRCTSYRATLEPSEIVQDPSRPGYITASSLVRVCESCQKKTGQRNGLASQASVSSTPTVDAGRRTAGSSQISDFANCPVCDKVLSGLGSILDQEVHVRNCLEGGMDSNAQMSRYVSYKLPPGSVQIGSECLWSFS